jgi:hypothetical protein
MSQMCHSHFFTIAWLFIILPVDRHTTPKNRFSLYSPDIIAPVPYLESPVIPQSSECGFSALEFLRIEDSSTLSKLSGTVEFL